MTGFDIGIGWHNRRGCGGSWSSWAFSFVTNEALGEVTPNHYKMVQLTILGFYFRVYLLGPIANIRNETEQCDGVTGDYMGRAKDLFADMEKDKVIQKINRAMQSFSREEMPLFIYEVLEQSRLHAESQEAQRELWHGRKPN